MIKQACQSSRGRHPSIGLEEIVHSRLICKVRSRQETGIFHLRYCRYLVGRYKKTWRSLSRRIMTIICAPPPPSTSKLLVRLANSLTLFPEKSVHGLPSRSERGMSPPVFASLRRGSLRRTAFAKAGAWSRNRTSDTRIFNPLLYQLSYPGPQHSPSATP